MAGTTVGGLKAAATNKSKFGPDFYRKIGAIGGAKGHTGGFYANRQLAREAGRIGGRISKRGPALRPRSEVDEVGRQNMREAQQRRRIREALESEGWDITAKVSWKSKFFRRFRGE